MKRVEFTIKTKANIEIIDITAQVNSFLRDSISPAYMCNIFVPHTTAGVTINENSDPDVMNDFLRKINQLIPANDQYRHIEGNSPAHIKTVLCGNSLMVPVIENKLLLGRWQGIYLLEFDGPRERKIILTFL
ncbi:MAG: hypothetical protein DDT22_00622 [candidate division WS2 bacterium]|nr:hypothetical protein [Candidatus Lithacetigena glycinireducens]